MHKLPICFYFTFILGIYGKETDKPCKQIPTLVENPEFAPTKEFFKIGGAARGS